MMEKIISVKVIVPTHSSALASLTLPLLPKIRGKSEDEKELIDYKSQIIQIHVHKERAMWNLFAPIFGSNNEKCAVSLVQVLVEELRSISLLKCKLLEHGRYQIRHDAKECDERTHDMKLTESTFCIRTKINMKKRKRVSLDKKANNHAVSLVIYILPPMPIPSLYHYPSMRPERIFTSSLVKLENLQIKLQSLNAYIATLGGGYFLCHFLSTAVCLARYQRRIALQLNDVNLAMKCTINEAYNYIHAGMIQKALSLIRKTEKEATMRKSNRMRYSMSGDGGDEEVILSMCKAAKWFAGCVRDGMNNLMSDENQLLPIGSRTSVRNDLNGKYQEVSATHDDFQRIRVVCVRTVAHGKKIL